MKKAVIVVALSFLCFSALSAETSSVYPGSTVSVIETQQMNFGKPANFPSATVYITSDPFEKAKTYYKGIGKEYMVPSNTKNADPNLKVAYFILDKAKNLNVSRKWLVIRAPHLTTTKVKKWFRTVTVVTTNTSITLNEMANK